MSPEWWALWQDGSYLKALVSSGGYVPLKGAYELLINFKPEGGSMKMICIPLPIAPRGGPGKVVVRADAVLDLSREEGLVEIHKMISGDTGLLLPGNGLRSGLVG